MSGQFVIVPARALDDIELRKTPAAYMILCTLSTYANRDGFCFVRNSTLANRANCSTRSIRTHTKRLAELGYLKIIPQYRDNRQVENAYRINHDIVLPSDRDYSAGVEANLPRGVEANLPTERLSLTIEREKTLTRDDFLRGIDSAFQNGKFRTPEFEHLTETEVITQASDCYASWGDDLRGREPYVMLNVWLRKGMTLGTVRKPSKAAKKEGEVFSVHELEEWKQALLSRGLVSEGELISWISKLEWNGNGTIYAPSQFAKQRIEKQFMPALREVTHSQIKIEVRA